MVAAGARQASLPVEAYPGHPHGVPTIHGDVISVDILAFTRG